MWLEVVYWCRIVSSILFWLNYFCGERVQWLGAPSLCKCWPCSVVQIPVMQFLGVDLCDNPVLAHIWRNIHVIVVWIVSCTMMVVWIVSLQYDYGSLLDMFWFQFPFCPNRNIFFTAGCSWLSTYCSLLQFVGLQIGNSYANLNVVVSL